MEKIQKVIRTIEREYQIKLNREDILRLVDIPENMVNNASISIDIPYNTYEVEDGDIIISWIEVEHEEKRDGSEN